MPLQTVKEKNLRHYSRKTFQHDKKKLQNNEQKLQSYKKNKIRIYKTLPCFGQSFMVLGKHDKSECKLIDEQQRKTTLNCFLLHKNH